jgi:hypothetical protein
MGGIAGLFENMRQNTQVNFSLQMKGYQLIVSRDWQKSKTTRRNCHPEL